MAHHPRTDLESAAIRFAGDFGDCIQLMGDQFARTSAALGNAVFTAPDLPGEIRSRPGTLGGVHAFQVGFGSSAITPGDYVHTLVAMTPAALRANLPDVAAGGIIVANTDSFVAEEWVKAGYDRDPLSDGTLTGYRVIRVPVTTLNADAVSALKLSPRDADRSRCFFVLGLMYWLYDRPLDATLHWLRDRFAHLPDVYKADRRSLKAGYQFGMDLPGHAGFRVAAQVYGPGVFRRVNGATALALGIAAAANRSGREALFASFPFAPAVELLHQLMELQPPGVCPLQAEDESAAASMALGASFGGSLGFTATAGPGLGNISDVIGLAVAAELPLVVIHTMRCGPALGVPGKPEQADLLQAIHGRNGESPVPVLAVRSPADGFDVVLEATRLTMRYMTPVIVLTDVGLLHAGEPWRVPNVATLPDLRPPASPPPPTPGKPFLPYARDVRLARPWVVPGTPGLEHRVGGLEKEDGTGVVSYEPADHEHMVNVRGQKIAQIAGDIPRLALEGPPQGDLLFLSWGGTYGAVRQAVESLRTSGFNVSHGHLRHLSPLPADTSDVLRRFKRVVVPELNCGQLVSLLRSQYSIDCESLPKVQGRQFLGAELADWARGSFRPRLLSPGVEL
ncbi:MAG: 2-oxoacid:acceptor oxidoreductase family protein [Gemmataceae bacterium]|nr:2-oxoacid:acceptor oxidoreductase family protein [Gemmataceae bacterium]